MQNFNPSEYLNGSSAPSVPQGGTQSGFDPSAYLDTVSSQPDSKPKGIGEQIVSNALTEVKSIPDVAKKLWEARPKYHPMVKYAGEDIVNAFNVVGGIAEGADTLFKKQVETIPRAVVDVFQKNMAVWNTYKQGGIAKDQLTASILNNTIEPVKTASDAVVGFGKGLVSDAIQHPLKTSAELIGYAIAPFATLGISAATQMFDGATPKQVGESLLVGFEQVAAMHAVAKSAGRLKRTEIKQELDAKLPEEVKKSTEEFFTKNEKLKTEITQEEFKTLEKKSIAGELDPGQETTLDTYKKSIHEEYGLRPTDDIFQEHGGKLRVEIPVPKEIKEMFKTETPVKAEDLPRPPETLAGRLPEEMKPLVSEVLKQTNFDTPQSAVNSYILPTEILSGTNPKVIELNQILNNLPKDALREYSTKTFGKTLTKKVNAARKLYSKYVTDNGNPFLRPESALTKQVEPAANVGTTPAIKGKEILNNLTIRHSLDEIAPDLKMFSDKEVALSKTKLAHNTFIKERVLRGGDLVDLTRTLDGGLKTGYFQETFRVPILKATRIQTILRTRWKHGLSDAIKDFTPEDAAEFKDYNGYKANLVEKLKVVELAKNPEIRMRLRKYSGFEESQIVAMEKSLELNPKELKLSNTLSEIHQDMYRELAPIFKQITGRDLPKIEFYTELHYKRGTGSLHESEMGTGSDLLTASLRPENKGMWDKFTETRQPNVKRPIDTTDAVLDIQKQIDNVSHYVGFSPEVDALYNSFSRVQNIMTEKLGPKISETLKQNLDYTIFKSGGPKEAYSNLLHRLEQKTVQAIFWVNPKTWLTQGFGTLPNIAEVTGWSNVLKAAKSVIENGKLIEERAFKESPMLEGSTVDYNITDAQIILKTARPTLSAKLIKLKEKIAEVGSAPISALDKFNRLVTYEAGRLKHLETFGEDIQGSIAAGEDLVFETQPNSFDMFKAPMHQGTGVVAHSTRFTSQTTQISQQFLHRQLELKQALRKGTISKAEFIYKMNKSRLNILVLPSVTVALFQTIFGPEKDRTVIKSAQNVVQNLSSTYIPILGILQTIGEFQSPPIVTKIPMLAGKAMAEMSTGKIASAVNTSIEGILTANGISYKRFKDAFKALGVIE
jgi:hypothetical protein